VPGTIEIKNAPWVEIRQVVNRSIVQQLREQARLDIGESEAISLALELKADLLLIDERRGRMEANRLGLRITGLLGLLIEAKQRDLIIAVKPLIDTLITTSAFRVSSALYNQILEIVNELE
jgi:predicted nucleic acid-binding protein